MRVLIVVFFTFISFNCVAQSAQEYNLNFEEKGQRENLAKGWFKWGNYPLALDSSVVHSGKYASKITSDSSGSSYGSVAYQIPANFEGETITLTGFMKIENVSGGHAGLLLRIDGGGTSLVFDNMSGQKINGTKSWTKYRITLKYPGKAEAIYLGGILTGKGKAWFDDFQLTIDGKDIEQVPEKVYPANQDHAFDKGSTIDFSELDKKLVNDLALLGKIWGFLKYHHPQIEEGNYNWDYELFRVLPKYMNNKNAIERDTILLSWINSLGGVPTCKSCPEAQSDAFKTPDLSWIDQSNMSGALTDKLHFIHKNRSKGNQYYLKMKGNPVFAHENAYSNMPYPDEGFRLLALYRYWNMIEYFYPYKKGMDNDWGRVLKKYIPTFINAENELKYELAANQLIGEIQDSHAILLEGNNKIQDLRGSYYPPFHTRFIDDKLVITDYYNPELKESAGLNVGDIITHISSRPVDGIVDSLKPYYPASNSAERMRAISSDLLRSKTNKININYITQGRQARKTLTLYKKDSLNYYRKYRKGDQKSYKMLEGNIGYVTLESIKKEDVKKIKEAFKDAKGIIIDIRNYPSSFVPYTLGSFFVSSPTPFAKFTTGSASTPGEFTFGEPVKIPAGDQAYKGKLVVIVNEFSKSQSEFTAMAFRAGDNTTIIGNTTAGADGSVSLMMLPGGLKTIISGMGVYYPDGTPTQRVGIVPDIEVEPTIEGIRKGEDELLRKAIEIINK